MNGEQLIAWRQAEGLSQNTAAKVLSVDRKALRGWERRPGAIPTLAALACEGISSRKIIADLQTKIGLLEKDGYMLVKARIKTGKSKAKRK